MRLKVKEGSEVPVSIISMDSCKRYLWISMERIPEERFPPCIRNMLHRASEEGSNRAGAVLASFLGQAGWSEGDALKLWKIFAERTGLSESLFRKWFARMNCPSCRTIKSEARGYPDLGLQGLSYCEPDERCRDISWPVAYSLDDPDWGWLKPLGRKNRVRVYNWITAREEELEVSDDLRGEIEKILAEIGSEQQIFVTKTREGGRLRIRFLVRDSELRKSVLSDLL
ncbi:hypothetical protein [Methanothrix thermoacetophila]|uniref:DNA primase large subunit C-terminal domain-containing protein n=1 Tax=Methanothrix thermoacetophila (strain DSM 6194 / JCM 14653 / NBRC 101360 / PT) TaxID=349307 RepID=A0B8X1_METTP|nr:hypothetical protein [Methanothrix thermoacetophila]ABK15145.1 hypothetical protein Mthe_1370 [Methanothrix thermoacetophila PT]